MYKIISIVCSYGNRIQRALVGLLLRHVALRWYYNNIINGINRKYDNNMAENTLPTVRHSHYYNIIICYLKT